MCRRGDFRRHFFQINHYFCKIIWLQPKNDYICAYLKINQMKKSSSNQLSQSLHCLLNQRLVAFKNEYFGSYVDWNIKNIENELKFYKKMHGQPDPNSKRIFNYLLQIIAHENILKNKNLLIFKFITEASEQYQQKLNKLVDKLVLFDMKTQHLRVEVLISESDIFSFLISNMEIEVHARVIFANGGINAPHYRFITTKRNK